MKRIIEKAVNSAAELIASFNSVSQKKVAADQCGKTDKSNAQLFARAAAEGAVLLKNNGVLPLENKECVSVFGRVQVNWFYTGYGSGGDVNRPYEVNLLDGIRACGKLSLNERLAQKYEKWCAAPENRIKDAVWGMWPRFYPEMPIEAADIFRASRESDCAVVVIGRSSGEDRDCTLEKGSWYLTDDERRLLNVVTDYFKSTVVLLNIGCIMDLAWLEEYEDKISAALLLWQGGQESGTAAADLLCGRVNPCGALADTVAKTYEDHPSAADFANRDHNDYTEDIYVGYRYFETFAKDRVLYPFGHGLSYTDFEIRLKSAQPSESGFLFNITVKNTGKKAGKTPFMLYVEKPQGVLGNPVRELAAFGKIGLLQPGEAQDARLYVSLYQLTSYDSQGACGSRSAYILQAGEHKFFLGKAVSAAEAVYTYYQEETAVFERLSENLAPQNEFDIINPVKSINGYIPVKRSCPRRKTDLRQKILDELPEAAPPSCRSDISFYDVADSRASMEEFVSTLSLDELEAITRGDYTMGSALGAAGNAGAFGGVLQSLRDKGVPPVITTDGPSGIRLSAKCSLIPIGSLLACAFDTALVEEVYSAIAAEMLEKGSDVLLAPGMNIHRNPLCGRNFEYYSEDPYVAGKTAAAAVRGIQSHGGSACPKHFACNNQEFARTKNDSRVSERALREIYLKGFEICVKEAQPKNIMTSYNKINGVYSHYNYELCTDILRKEWGYKGNVMTDWWMQKGVSPEFPKLRDNAYRVRAQVDVLMPGGSRTGRRKPDGTLLESLGDRGGITLAELQRSAANVLKCALDSTAYTRFREYRG